MATMEHRPPYPCQGNLVASQEEGPYFLCAGWRWGEGDQAECAAPGAEENRETESLHREVWRWQGMGQHVREGFRPPAHAPFSYWTLPTKIQLLRISRG